MIRQAHRRSRLREAVLTVAEAIAFVLLCGMALGLIAWVGWA
jgi:hypothetical protein